MKSAAVCLVLLFCLQWTWAQGEGDQSSITANIWAELKELRDMVTQQNMELRNSKSKIQKLEQDNTDLLARVTTSENKNTANTSEGLDNLVFDWIKHNKMDSELIQQLDKLLGLTVDSQLSWIQHTDMIIRKRGISISMARKCLPYIPVHILEVPKVAFSVGLTDEGSVGPFAYDEMMIFSKVFTNIGQAYNTTTGFFTAPVRGVYYFRFTAWNSYRSSNIAISLYHNDNRISRNEDKNDDVAFVTVHNAFVLQLEQRDVVYMVQNGGRPLYDDWFNRTTFNGFLLFTL